MSELNAIVNAPIGAVFFVCGAISVFGLLAVFILQKGTELHSFLGYLYFFGLSFTNYAAAMSYSEGLLPFPAIAFTIPTTTLFLILGLASIIPSSKSIFRIRVHIVSMICSTTSVLVGTLINWYHFSVTPLLVFRWDDLFSILILSVPIFGLGILLTIRFLSTANSYYKKEDLIVNAPSDVVKKITKGNASQSKIHYKELEEAINQRGVLRETGF